MRRGVRAVEGARLESVCAGNRTACSNHVPSAIARHENQNTKKSADYSNFPEASSHKITHHHGSDLSFVLVMSYQETEFSWSLSSIFKGELTPTNL